MKPIKLKVKSFLGFQSETIIDFTELYSDKIFLITGATGSGKTSIFDAITYALYGEGSGNERNKAKCYMSHLADKDDTMEVSLEFSVKGENYFVERFDSEYIPSRKKAKFYKEGKEEEAITRLGDILKEVEDVIGLNAEQFKKIVMLPQGEFKEFLSSSTKDKTEILKKLFATEIYEDLQRNIKVKNDKAKLDNQRLIERFRESLAEVGLYGEDIETGYESLKNLISKEEKLSKDINLKKTKLKTDLDNKKREKDKNIAFNKGLHEYLNIEKEYYDLLSKQEEIEIKDKNLKNIYKSRTILVYENRINEEKENLLEAKQKLSGLNKNIVDFLKIKEENEKKFVEYKNDYINLDVLKEKLRIKEDKKDRINLANELISRLNATETRFKILNKSLLDLKEMEKEKEILKEKIIEARENSFAIKEKLRSIVEDIKENEKTLKTLREIFALIDETQKNKEERALKSKTIEILRREIKLAEDNLKLENEKRKGNYALILKNDLKEGDPCLVCGSKEHPGISLKKEDFSGDLIEKLEETISIKSKELNDLENAFNILVFKGETTLKEIDKLKKEYKIDFKDQDQLTKIGEGYAKENKSLTSEKDAILQSEEKNNNFLKESTKKLTELSEKLEKREEIEREHKESNIEIIQLKQSIKSLKLKDEDLEKGKEIEGKIESLKDKINKTTLNYDKGLKIKDENIEKHSTLNTKKSNLSELLSSLKEKIAAFERAFEDKLKKESLDLSSYNLYKKEVGKIEVLENEISSFNKDLNTSYGMYSHLKDDYKGKEAIDLTEIKKNITELSILLEKKEEEAKKIEYNLRTYKNTEKRVKDLEKNYKDKREELKILEDLYNTSSVGLTFETFVQSYHFEGILERANIRLSKMTKGRYSLRRRTEGESRSKKIGLDIDIFDEYSGRERDVLSLSGGESFKASLALALGLSEFIESASGNVNLDTIFIDEGFGSLDEESLDSALECLLELNLSGRIVGIISHVAELKERIPKKIEVKSVPGEGSEIKIN